MWAPASRGQEQQLPTLSPWRLGVLGACFGGRSADDGATKEDAHFDLRVIAACHAQVVREKQAEAAQASPTALAAAKEAENNVQRAHALSSARHHDSHATIVVIATIGTPDSAAVAAAAAAAGADATDATDESSCDSAHSRRSAAAGAATHDSAWDLAYVAEPLGGGDGDGDVVAIDGELLDETLSEMLSGVFADGGGAAAGTPATAAVTAAAAAAVAEAKAEAKAEAEVEAAAAASEAAAAAAAAAVAAEGEGQKPLMAPSQPDATLIMHSAPDNLAPAPSTSDPLPNTDSTVASAAAAASLDNTPPPPQPLNCLLPPASGAPAAHTRTAGALTQALSTCAGPRASLNHRSLGKDAPAAALDQSSNPTARTNELAPAACAESSLFQHGAKLALLACGELEHTAKLALLAGGEFEHIHGYTVRPAFVWDSRPQLGPIARAAMPEAGPASAPPAAGRLAAAAAAGTAAQRRAAAAAAASALAAAGTLTASPSPRTLRWQNGVWPPTVHNGHNSHSSGSLLGGVGGATGSLAALGTLPLAAAATLAWCSRGAAAGSAPAAPCAHTLAGAPPAPVAAGLLLPCPPSLQPGGGGMAAAAAAAAARRSATLARWNAMLLKVAEEHAAATATSHALCHHSAAARSARLSVGRSSAGAAGRAAARPSVALSGQA